MHSVRHCLLYNLQFTASEAPFPARARHKGKTFNILQYSFIKILEVGIRFLDDVF